MSKKFSRYRKVRVHGVASRGDSVEYGRVGLKAQACGKITKKQIESARVVIMRSCSRKGKLFIRPSAFFPVSKKPLEVRMGGGKGPVDHHVARVRAGMVLFELDGVDMERAQIALKNASYKLNIPCVIVFRRFANISDS